MVAAATSSGKNRGQSARSGAMKLHKSHPSQPEVGRRTDDPCRAVDWQGSAGLQDAISLQSVILKAGGLYFALTFAAGLVLGTIRVLRAVPRFGERTAGLMETPLKFVVTILAARWTAQRLVVPRGPFTRLGVGCAALALLLIAEFNVVLWIRGLTIDQYFASRDPVAGTAYLVLLGVFAIMPLLVARR